MLVEVGDQIFRIVEGRASPVIRIVLRSLRKKKMKKIDARVVLRHPAPVGTKPDAANLRPGQCGPTWLNLCHRGIRG